MAVEIFFRVAAQGLPTGDKALEVKRYQRGDCVIWKPEGWGWGSIELTHPEHRIVRFTKMTVSEAEALISTELDAALSKTHTWKRIRRLDLDSLLITDGAFKTFLFDDTRAVPMFRFTGKLTLIDNITVTKSNADTVVP